MQRIEETKSIRGSKFVWAAIALAVVVLAFVLPSYMRQTSAESASGLNFELLSASSAPSVGGERVHIGGVPIGISLGAGGLIVQSQSAVRTERGDVYPASESGIQKGDVILKMDGEPTRSLYLLKRALEDVRGEARLTVSRKGVEFETFITPAMDLSGQKRLGLMLKEDLGGIGTLTFVTQDGRFGALGHYVQDGETGLKDELASGKIYPTSVEGVIKGEVGKAGGLQADVNRLFKPLGTITQNDLIGIYGDYTATPAGELVRVAEKGEAKMGAAQVLTTIEGDEPKLYDIDIVKVISQSEADEKGMVIAVRDDRLLEKTGGIVQGMSGSPILQNGVFIGAVTHVFVQDPTRGYAVHSRFMVQRALEAQSLPNAA